ncbi:hypothetical protein CgunFtcFv8_027098 [Champsocephalus gunnari]|uniref:Uncharacterized protein n=1 Tax=Champsocephalus gunnari TaxID=52237 RepID=A0AAN8DZ34_CHAGU|nr:hypothetical protein CgunFtcFv8_027098 [Champsocephalus gunnari]
MTEQDPFSLSPRLRLFPLWLFASSPASGGEDSERFALLYSPILSSVLGHKARGLTDFRRPLRWSSLLWRCVLSRASAGLCPGVVSSLDVAHSLIRLSIGLFTRGSHKEMQGGRELERGREELSSHIWVDGTHGESTSERSAVSPNFSCALPSAL